MNKKIISATILAVILSGCDSNGGSTTTATPPTNNSTIIKDLGFLKIEKTPTKFKNYEAKGYTRYVGYKAPNGENIHFLIQDKLTDFQIARSYNILKHYLTNDQKFAYDKSEVANTMANNNAILKLQNGSHTPSNEDDLMGQPLYQNEIQVEGGEWYMNQDYTHRDASYEEILHLVHDFGFGVLNSSNGIAGAIPQLQLGINHYQKLAYRNNVWTPEKAEYDEWENEISLDQEYFASVIDSYYGLWGAWSDASNLASSNSGMWGVYKIKTRDDFTTGSIRDAVVADVENLFHPTFQYTAYLSDQLSGEFSMKFDASKSYTHHSQYLNKIKLNGSNNIKVIPNDRYNYIEGNDGVTTLVLKGKPEDYLISYNPDGRSPNAVVRGKGLGNILLENVDGIEFRK